MITDPLEVDEPAPLPMTTPPPVFEEDLPPDIKIASPAPDDDPTVSIMLPPDPPIRLQKIFQSYHYYHHS